MNEEVARETILEYARSSKNGALIGAYTHRGVAENHACGDSVEFRFHIENDRIVASSFRARGCALCTAATAILDEHIRDAAAETVCNESRRFESILTGDPDETWPEEFAAFRVFAAIRRNTRRRRCVLLPWEAMRAALEG